MDANQISALAGSLLAILFEYIPGLSDWYEPKTAPIKRLIMLGSMVLVVAATYGLSCLGRTAVFVCTSSGIWDAIYALVTAIVFNQGTHMITKKS
jgi:hypothetical protein